MKPTRKKRNPKSRSDRNQKFDRKVFSKVWEGRTWKLIVTVSSFKGGKPKLLITRERAGKKFRDAPYSKLGRLSREELEGILPILEEARHHL